MANSNKPNKTELYGHITAIIGALLIMLMISMFGAASDISILIVLVISPALFSALMTIDSWQEYFSSWIFRYHLIFILALIWSLPIFFSFLLVGPGGFGALIFIPSILILVGIILTSISHIAMGFRPRVKTRNMKIKIVAFLATFVVAILGVASIALANNQAYNSELKEIASNFLTFIKIHRDASANKDWEKPVMPGEVIGKMRIDTAKAARDKAFGPSLAAINDPDTVKNSRDFEIFPWHKKLIRAQNSLIKTWRLFNNRNSLILNKNPNNKFTADSARQWNDLTTKLKGSEEKTAVLLKDSTKSVTYLNKLARAQKFLDQQHAK